MYIVYMKGNAAIYKAGFETWDEAKAYGKIWFGPKGFYIDIE